MTFPGRRRWLLFLSNCVFLSQQKKVTDVQSTTSGMQLSECLVWPQRYLLTYLTWAPFFLGCSFFSLPFAIRKHTKHGILGVRPVLQTVILCPSGFFFFYTCSMISLSGLIFPWTAAGKRWRYICRLCSGGGATERSEIGEPKVGLENNTRVELIRWGLYIYIYVGYVGFNNVQYRTIHINQPVQWRRGMFHGSNGGTKIGDLSSNYRVKTSKHLVVGMIQMWVPTSWWAKLKSTAVYLVEN